MTIEKQFPGQDQVSLRVSYARFLFRSNPRASRGISMLEFAMALPVLLFTVMATLDVTAVLQARTALQQAATTSLRCVYPVDGACLASSGDQRTRYYDYYRLPPGTDNHFIIGRDDFSGVARFFKAPRRELINFRAPLLGSAYFDVARARYHVSGRIEGHRILQPYRVIALLAAAPYLHGTSPRTPTFSLSRSGGEFPESTSAFDPLAARLSPALQRSGSGATLTLQGNEQSTDWQTAYSFTIEQPTLAALCQGSNCDLLSGRNTRVVFHLKGSAASSGPGGCGSVGLRLVSGSSNLDLTGQHFEIHGAAAALGAQQANFYPRGLTNADVMESWRTIEEFGRGAIRADFGSHYQIQVRLSRANNPGCDAATRVSWNASDVSFYLPVFARLPDQETRCAGLVLDQSLPSEFACVPESDSIHAQFYSGSARVESALTLIAIADDEVSGAVSPEHAKHLLLMQHLGAATTNAMVNGATGAQMPLNVVFREQEAPATFSIACPANYGVADQAELVPHENPALAIRNSSQALERCPISLESNTATAPLVPFSPEISNVRWTETAPVPIPHSPISWTKWNCGVSAPEYATLPPELRVYPEGKLTWNDQAAEHQSYEIVTTGRESDGNPANDPHDPAVLKQSDPLYACPELEVGSFVYDDSNRALDRRSVFVGVHDNIDACDRGQILRQAAENAAFIPEAQRLLPTMFFSPGTPRRRDRIESTEPPANECVAFQLRDSQVVGRGERVAGGPFAEGETPAACSGTAYCRRVFHHFGDGSAGETVVLTKQAEELGNRELFAAVPWTARSCGSQTCGNVHVQENSPVPGMLSATAQAKVRLSTLLGREVTLQHTHHERLETELLTD